MLAGIRRELKPMIGLAVPVVLAEVGWTTMGLVDTLMVGSLGPAAIGAVGLVIVGVVLFRTWHQRAKHAAFHNLHVVTPA